MRDRRIGTQAVGNKVTEKRHFMIKSIRQFWDAGVRWAGGLYGSVAAMSGLFRKAFWRNKYGRDGDSWGRAVQAGGIVGLGAIPRPSRQH